MMKTIARLIIIMLPVMAHDVWSADRIELDDTAIVGSRELPKVLYIVPWKKTRVGTLAGVSENTSFDDGLTALDREVLQKEAEYYDILYGSADAPNN